jgi:hypothetical protein
MVVVVVVVVQGVECPMAHLYEVDQLPLWKVGIMQTRSPALGFNMFYTILHSRPQSHFHSVTR